MPESFPAGIHAVQIDYDYLKRLLEAFAAAPRPTTDIRELAQAGVDYETDIFLFHIEILLDKGFIQRQDGEPGIGIVRSIDDFITWNVLPLRLTASGHEFLDGLRNQEAMAVLKSKFKHAGIDTAKAIFKTVIEESVKGAVKAFLPGAGPG